MGCGLAVGTATAIPVLVVGSGGVFVAASVYHVYIAAQRATNKLVGGPATEEETKLIDN